MYFRACQVCTQWLFLPGYEAGRKNLLSAHLFSLQVEKKLSARFTCPQRETLDACYREKVLCAPRRKIKDHYRCKWGVGRKAYKTSSVFAKLAKEESARAHAHCCCFVTSCPRSKNAEVALQDVTFRGKFQVVEWGQHVTRKQQYARARKRLLLYKSSIHERFLELHLHRYTLIVKRRLRLFFSQAIRQVERDGAGVIRRACVCVDTALLVAWRLFLPTLLARRWIETTSYDSFVVCTMARRR